MLKNKQSIPTAKGNPNNIRVGVHSKIDVPG
jgi:hypothetical protein